MSLRQYDCQQQVGLSKSGNMKVDIGEFDNVDVGIKIVAPAEASF
jgi:hypothetical protein